jgi:thioredoxin 1
MVLLVLFGPIAFLFLLLCKKVMSEFNKAIQSSTPTLVDFYAKWCGPCKTMEPVFEQFKQHAKNRIRVIKVDVDKNQAVAARFKIRSIPTMILFKNGEIIWKKSGALTLSQIKNELNRFM